MNGSDVEDAGGLDQIQPALVEIVDYLRQSQERQKKYKWWNRVTTLAILVVFVGFVFAFYQMFSRNLSSENFQKGFEKSMGQLAPEITDAAKDVLTEVGPVFVDLASKKAEEIAPAIMNSLEGQTNQFITNMSMFAETRFKSSLERVVEKVAADFRKAYPDLTDAEIERFITDTDLDFKNMFSQIAEQIVEDTLPEILEMKYLAESMTDQDMPKNSMELYRLFLHNMLLLLDKEIMEG